MLESRGVSMTFVKHRWRVVGRRAVPDPDEGW